VYNLLELLIGERNIGRLEYLLGPKFTARFQVCMYFPAVDSSQETGARRGSVVICREPEVAARLDAMDTLKRHTPS
jgi:hypothetical protein